MLGFFYLLKYEFKYFHFMIDLEKKTSKAMSLVLGLTSSQVITSAGFPFVLTLICKAKALGKHHIAPSGREKTKSGMGSSPGKPQTCGAGRQTKI